jgi:predicted acetyltransferase
MSRSEAALSFAAPRPDEIEPMDEMLEQALTFAPGTMAPWTQLIGHRNMRVVRRAERVVAGIGVIPFGHWFGGRVVPAGGITAVGVAPDQRGSGVGLWMLRRTLEEQREQGLPIATLYPATTSFYRRAGFERAAQRIIYELPAAALGGRDHALEAVPVGPEQYDLIKAVYAKRAAHSAAFIERPDFLWDRILSPPDKRSYTFVVLRDGEPEGYVVFAHTRWGEPLLVRDIIALTPAAGRRLLTLLADHRSMVDAVRFPGGPHDPLLFLMPEQKQKVHNTIDLMLRILDVPVALAARGYTPGVTGEVHFDVVDDLLPSNSGRFVLRVADGVGLAEPGGSGRIRLHIRDLAALYSGYYTPLELRQAGDVEASDADLAAAGLVFGGPRPWLPDMF